MYKTKLPEIKKQSVLNEGKVNMAFMPYAKIPGELEGLKIEISICPFPSGTLFRFCDIDTNDDSADIVSTSYQFIPGCMMVACSDNTDQDIHLYDESGFNVKSLRILFEEDDAKWRKLSRKDSDVEQEQVEEVEEDDKEDSDEQQQEEPEYVDNTTEIIEPDQVEEFNENNDDEDDIVEQEPEPVEDKPHIRSIGTRQETSRKEPMRREEPEKKKHEERRQKDDRRERQERRDAKAFGGAPVQQHQETKPRQQQQPNQNQRQRFDQRQRGNVQERPQQQPRRDNCQQNQQQPRRDERRDNRNETRRKENVSKPSFDFTAIVNQAYSASK